MSEKVSIIIPIYNVELWLDECINSVVGQTYKNLEIILVDDGSTDKSGEICDKWKEKDDRIFVVHKKNGGLSSARNAGLDVISGEFVTFIDSDDYIANHAIETMVNEMIDKNVDLVRCAMNKVVDGKVIESKDIFKEKIYYKEEALDKFYLYQDGFCGSVCDKLFKASAFEKLRFPDGLNSEDYLVLLQIYYGIDSMYYDNKCFYNYRTRANSICTTKKITEHSFDKIKISNKVLELTKKKCPERINDAKIYQVISRFYTYSNTLPEEENKTKRKEWLDDLKSFKKIVNSSCKLDKKFKLKYSLLLINWKFYVWLEKKYLGK